MDIIAYTWDHPAPRTLVIISGDRDLAYMIGTLRMRKYEVILISPNGTHTSFTNQASVNLDWIADSHRGDIDDARGGQPSPQPPSHQSPSPHTPSPPHQFPSPSFPSPPLPAANGFFSHYPKTNFLSKAEEINPPLVELRGMPVARDRQKPFFSHSDGFDIFGDLGGSFSSPSVPNGMFGLGGSHSQPHSARQVRSDSAPPDIYTIHSPVSPPLDSNGSGKIPSSAKGKQRKFPITELEDTAPQSPLTAKLPEEPPMAEGLFTSMHPLAKMRDPLSVPTSGEPVNIDNDNRTERGKSPTTTIIISPRKEEAISTKESPRADLLNQPQAPDPSPTPLLLSQKSPPSKGTSHTTLKAQAGPSRSSTPSQKLVPPHFQVLVDTLRQHGGSYKKSSLACLLLTRDKAAFKKAKVSKYKPYIATAVEARLVREVATAQGPCISLTEEYT